MPMGWTRRGRRRTRSDKAEGRLASIQKVSLWLDFRNLAIAHSILLIVDALMGIGHACGHNLIAISGCAAALGVAAALKKHNIAGKIVLLGTPAEEGGGGKAELLALDAYKGMDACLM